MTQRLGQFEVKHLQGTRDPQSTGTSLARQAAAIDFDVDIHDRLLAEQFQGTRDEHAILDGGEVGIHRTAVHRNGPRSRPESHAGNGCFPAARGNHIGFRFALLGGLGGHSCSSVRFDVRDAWNMLGVR